MPPIEFPDPETASEDGIVALGADLEPETLVTAYRNGIFPWPIDGIPHIPWFSPDPRGILYAKNFHQSQSFQRFIKKTKFTHTFNRAFKEVILSCADVKRKRQRGTWITRGIMKAYSALNKLGFAHSIEVWNGEKLVGGVYGVCVDHVFAAESMFHNETNASKFALYKLLQALEEKKISWIDVQVLNPHVESLGAENIPRKKFLALLKKSQRPGLLVLS